MNLSIFAQVWTAPSALLAIVTGVAFGLAVGWISVNPAYSSGLAAPLRIAMIAFLFAASGGLTFYAGQALGSYLSGDPLWVRVLSRYGQWIVFSLAIAVTTWYLTWRDRRIRRRKAHDRLIEQQHRGEGDH